MYLFLTYFKVGVSACDARAWTCAPACLAFLILGFASKAVGDGRGTAIEKKKRPFSYWFEIGMSALVSAAVAYMTT
jgi:hypothetical protein